MNKELQERVIKDTEEKIKKLLDDGIQSNNLMLLGQLIDIQKDMKKMMMVNISFLIMYISVLMLVVVIQ